MIRHQTITYLVLPYSAKFQKSGTFINSHSHIRNQCWTLNRTSTGHSTHHGVTPFNLANLFRSEVCRHTSKMNNKRCLLTQQKCYLRGATLQNVHKVGIQVYPPPSLWVCRKTKKTFLYAINVYYNQQSNLKFAKFGVRH